MHCTQIARVCRVALATNERLLAVIVLLTVVAFQVAAYGWRESWREPYQSAAKDLPRELRSIATSVVSRNEKPVPGSGTWSDWPDSTRALNRPNRIKNALPPGKGFDVTVRGEIAATLDDWEFDLERSRHVFYVFEARYWRTIESNDGYRVVERRDYGMVRRGKLIVPVGETALPDHPFVDWSFATIAFPSPSDGIGVVSARQMADALLQPSLRHLADDRWSRGYAECDSLSGRSVRLTYRDGVGVESVEAIGWEPTNEQLRYLTQRSVLIDCYFPAHTRGHVSKSRRVLVKGIGDFVFDPAFELRADSELGILASNSLARQSDGRARMRNGPPSPHHKRRKTPTNTEDRTMIGTAKVQYDSEGKYVRSAEILLNRDSFGQSEFHLLHENLAKASTNATVRYDCSLMAGL